MDVDERETDLLIIGAGLAGLAAASFAVQSGLRVAVVAWSRGEMPFASGLLDLLGVYPVEERNLLDDPWAGVARLALDNPEHPYARAGAERIREAWEKFESFLGDAGLSYRGHPDLNVSLATAAGSVKTTYRVPDSMWAGVGALREAKPTLIVDFEGMKELSAVQVVEMLRGRWAGLHALRVEFPLGFPGKDRHNILMAEALEAEDVRSALAEKLRRKAKDFECVGFPAVLGMRSSVASDLAAMIGKPVFEIPTLPPSVPGQRLMEALDRSLMQNGAKLLTGRRALGFQSHRRLCSGVVFGDDKKHEELRARGILLASGRFIGGGLTADLGHVREAIFNLPVCQPESRENWHRKSFFDLRGHPVNQSGIVVDDHFRPLSFAGDCAFENLFAAGSLLGRQDWMREKSGAGIALATAYCAVESYRRLFGRT